MGWLTEEAWWADIEAVANCKNFADGDTIRFQDDGGVQSIGLVGSGKVEAIHFTFNGHETWLGQFQMGDIVSHDALLDDASGAPGLIAVGATTVYFIPVKALLEVLGGRFSVSTMVSQNLAAQIHGLIGRLADVYSLSAKGRICAELVRLAAPAGVSPGTHVIRPNPVFIDVARRLNTTRETVSRTVGDLIKEDVLTRTKGALIVNDVDRLETRFI